MYIRMACWPSPKMYHQKSKLGHTYLGIKSNASWISKFQIVKMTTHPVLLIENVCYSPIMEAFLLKTSFLDPHYFTLRLFLMIHFWWVR